MVGVGLRRKGCHTVHLSFHKWLWVKSRALRRKNHLMSTHWYFLLNVQYNKAVTQHQRRTILILYKRNSLCIMNLQLKLTSLYAWFRCRRPRRNQVLLFIVNIVKTISWKFKLAYCDDLTYLKYQCKHI